MIRTLFFYLLMFSVTLALLEGLVFATTMLIDRDEFFDARASVFASFKEDHFAFFKSRKADELTGWKNYGPLKREEESCLGRKVTYTYNAEGVRVHDNYDPLHSPIVSVGDSYTNGHEVNDNEAYPAQLSKLLGVSVANLGVGGYGPVQSVLNLEKNIGEYPKAKIVVLGIMYENLYRMMNSYRPVLYSTTSYYAFKPYMSQGRVVPHPGMTVFENLDDFKAAADHAFDVDFWAKPRARFPYLLSLLRSLDSNYFYYRKLQKGLRDLGKPEYAQIFASQEVAENLVVLLNRFAANARKLNMQPLAVFIPRNSMDIVSAASFLTRHRADIDSTLVLGDVAQYADVDWARFNLREEDEGDYCHPSPYGYSVIARYVADLLSANALWPVATEQLPEMR